MSFHFTPCPSLVSHQTQLICFTNNWCELFIELFILLFDFFCECVDWQTNRILICILFCICYNQVMENKKTLWFKILATILFATAICIMYIYVIARGDLPHDALCYACIFLSFIFSLLFIRRNSKSTFITIALGINVISDYFLVYNLSDENMIPGLCVFLIAQLFYFLYTFFLTKKLWVRLLNIFSRVVICLVLCLTLTPVLYLGVLENLTIIYITNFIISLIFLFTDIKSEWFKIIGFTLFILCDLLVGLYFGGDFIELPSAVENFLYLQDWSFILYIPGNFIISLSTVWKFGRKQTPQTI